MGSVMAVAYQTMSAVSLTDALRMMTTFSHDEVDRRAHDPAEDPMVRNVCRWRREAPKRVAELLQLCGLWATTKNNSYAGVQLSEQGETAVIERLRWEMGHDRVWLDRDLAQQVQCSTQHLHKAISRIRAEGFFVETLTVSDGIRTGTIRYRLGSQMDDPDAVYGRVLPDAARARDAVAGDRGRGEWSAGRRHQAVA